MTACESETTLQITTLLILRCEPRREADATGVRPMPRASLEGRTCEGPATRPERRRHHRGTFAQAHPRRGTASPFPSPTHASPFPRLAEAGL